MSFDLWISAAEELPDSDITVLVATDHGEVWAGYWDGELWRGEDAAIFMHEITHWQHYPAHPNFSE